MIKLKLTDWDDFIIRKAIAKYTYLNLKKIYPGQLNKKQWSVAKAYLNSRNNKHDVNWSVYAVKQLRYYVCTLRNQDEEACRFQSNHYFNPHFYEPVINKLNHALYSVPKKIEVNA